MKTYTDAETVSLSTDHPGQASPFRWADSPALLHRWPVDLTEVHDRIRKALPVPADRITSEFGHDAGGLTHLRTTVVLDGTDDLVKLAAVLDPDLPATLAQLLPNGWGGDRAVRLL